MSLSTRLLSRSIQKANTKNVRTVLTAIENATVQEQLHLFRTTESNPTNHDTSHLNKFYTIPANIYTTLLSDNGIRKRLAMQMRACAENSILIREPAIEIFSCLRQTDYTRPVNKYILYGKQGTGKTVTLAHVLHYAFMENSMLVHLPQIFSWFKRPIDTANSPLIENMIDLPFNASKWLKHFKRQNQALLTKLNLTLSKDYTWTQREISTTGSSLIELIDFGTKRIKFACGVVNALIEELKAASTAGTCRTIVIVDSYNSFLMEQTAIRNDKREIVPAKNVTLTMAFSKLVQSDWCNGAVILALNTNGEKNESELPKYLLGSELFEELNPFIPIEVPNYTAAEFESVIDYYKDRKWIRNITEEGQRELELLTDRNPFQLSHYCMAL